MSVDATTADDGDELPTTNPLAELAAFRRDMLVTIDSFEGKPSGQMVLDRLEGEGGYPDVNHGRLYPGLDELVEMNLITRGSKDRRTNEYGLTDLGKRTLDEYREYVC